MNKHLSIEDISAFLDGEHARPEDVRKHLQQCAECAREHVALQKLSSHVQSLPECEVTFGFTARVMRNIETPQPAHKGRRWFWLPIGAGFAAALAMITLVDQNRPTLNDSSALVAIQPAVQPEPDLSGALGPDGSERDQFGGYPNLGNDVQIAYASEVATRPVPREFFTGADYNESLVALDAREKEILFQLLGSTLIDEHMM